MAKGEFFLKFKFKNYNNELENILEEKSFSESSENLILNLFYKIEASYDDYSKVKIYTKNKNDFIQQIICNIKKYCENITIINPISKKNINTKSVKLNYIKVDKGQIKVYPSEEKILYAISMISKENILIHDKYSIIKKSLINFLQVGDSINTVEVIRDFNGWSWISNINEICNVWYNIVYQNLLILLGENFINNWINNENYVLDYIDNMQMELEEKYTEELANKFINLFYKIIILIYIEIDEKEKLNIIRKKERDKEELEKIENKLQYIEDITKNKKNFLAKIRKIDEIVNDRKKLEKEFVTRNKLLEKQDRIFSISDLVEIINKERINTLEQIKECNELLDPKKFVQNKKNLEKEIEFLKDLNIEEKHNIFFEIQNFQCLFLECFEKNILKADSKKLILNLIYIFRYYNLIIIKPNLYIKDIKKIKDKLNYIEEILIKKAYELKAISNFSEDKEIEKVIIDNVFDIRLIELEKLDIIINKNNYMLDVKYYDGNILEKEISISMNEKIKEEKIKLDKRIRLFL